MKLILNLECQTFAEALKFSCNFNLIIQIIDSKTFWLVNSVFLILINESQTDLVELMMSGCGLVTYQFWKRQLSTLHSCKLLILR
jgi:hypothetical protein